MIADYRINDCKKIQRAFKKNGIDISLHKAQKLWERHSEIFCGCWEADVEWLSEQSLFDILIHEYNRRLDSIVDEDFYSIANRVRIKEDKRA